MKLGQVVAPQFIGSLRKLMDSDIPILTAWKLKAAASVVETESLKFEDLRRKLVDKYAEKNEDGTIKKDDNGVYRVPDSAVPDFTKEVNELLTADVEIQPLKISSLGDKVVIKPSELSALEGLIVE